MILQKLGSHLNSKGSYSHWYTLVSAEDQSQGYPTGSELGPILSSGISGPVFQTGCGDSSYFKRISLQTRRDTFALKQSWSGGIFRN